MAASLLVRKLWIQTSCRPGEGWVPPGYSCLTHYTSSSPMSKPGFETINDDTEVTYPNDWFGYFKYVDYLSHCIVLVILE